MNNFIMRKFTVSASYQPLASSRLVASVTISCPPGNVGNVNFKGDDGTDVPWIPGEWHDFQRINLAEVQVKGTAGDTVTVVGGTW
jgi:hypothetical protein